MKTWCVLWIVALTVLTGLNPMAFASQVRFLRTPDEGIQPQVVSDPHGVVHLLYYKGPPEGGDLYYVRRRPSQTEFSPPIRVNRQPGSALAIGTIRGAQLAVGKNGRVHVAWNGRAPTQGNYMEAPMLYTRLSDAGTTFEPERNVITSARGLDGGGSVAADNAGNVYVFWHAPQPGNSRAEAGRAVFVARSMNDGQTFTPEKLATSKPTGACGCCGMKAFADAQGDLLAFYRGASEDGNRNEIVLLSRDFGRDFDLLYEHAWKIGSCPMSSAFFSETPQGEVLAAGETHDRVFFIRADPKTGTVSPPISPEAKGKHPVVVANARGEVLLAWTEGTAWAKGGAVAWQIYDGHGKPVGEAGRADGLPTWSLVAAYAAPTGDFVIVY